MALPIVEKIAAEIVTRLETITTDNGFEFDVESVTRPRRLNRDFTPRNLSIVVTLPREESAEESDYPGNPPASAWNAIFEIYGYVRESDDATTSPAITEHQLGAAIRKAITEDSQWHTLGDNAINARFTALEYISQGGSLPFTAVEFNGVMVTLEVLYRVSELDPYALRA